MKVKIIGFKVGKPYPTFNRTLEPKLGQIWVATLGIALQKALDKSDFISIRWVN